MKLILCSVCLAHGAVVYTVCTPFCGGLFQHKNPSCTFEFSHSSSNQQAPQIQKSKTQSKASAPTFILKKTSSGNSSKTTPGWQIEGDFSIDTPHDLTIRFAVNSQGHISDIHITPFDSNIYRVACHQLKKFKFIWNNTSSPPSQTIFEKKICIRY